MAGRYGNASDAARVRFVYEVAEFSVRFRFAGGEAWIYREKCWIP